MPVRIAPLCLISLMGAVSSLVMVEPLPAQNSSSAAADPAAKEARKSETGFWKAVVPPSPVKGEFDGYDPIGLEAGVKLKADCSINWIDPDDGKRYCFSSGSSLVSFLGGPKSHIERARRRWGDMNKTSRAGS